MTDFSAVGKRSKRRGNRYERRVAKLLLKFTGVNFRRVPTSGGFNKLGSIIREDLFRGDLVCDDSNFQFCIEAKSRKNFTFTQVLKNPDTANFTNWWYQCVNDAKAADLIPLLFFKPDSQSDFIAVPDSIIDINCPHFVLAAYNMPRTLKIKQRGQKQLKKIIAKLPTPKIINWKDFIKTFPSRELFNGMLRTKERNEAQW